MTFFVVNEPQMKTSKQHASENALHLKMRKLYQVSKQACKKVMKFHIEN